jgi:hypothetical protein
MTNAQKEDYETIKAFREIACYFQDKYKDEIKLDLLYIRKKLVEYIEINKDNLEFDFMKKKFIIKRLVL